MNVRNFLPAMQKVPCRDMEEEEKERLSLFNKIGQNPIML